MLLKLLFLRGLLIVATILEVLIISGMLQLAVNIMVAIQLKVFLLFLRILKTSQSCIGMYSLTRIGKAYTALAHFLLWSPNKKNQMQRQQTH